MEYKIKNKQKNKVKNRDLLQKWEPVLSADLGPKILKQTEAYIVASLLETQTLLNKGYCHDSVKVTPAVAVYQQYALPLIRRDFIYSLPFKTCSVIPTTTESGIYNAYRYSKEKEKFIHAKGSVLVGTVRISRKFDKNQPGVEANNIEFISGNMRDKISQHILNAMLLVCSDKKLNGNSTEIINTTLDKIVDELHNNSKKIRARTKVKGDVFAICSNDIISELESHVNYNKIEFDASIPIREVGFLRTGNIRIIEDTTSEKSYSLVGINGYEAGHSGILFIPYIPYIFSKGKGKDNLVLESRYAIVRDIKNSGDFYNYTEYK